MSATPARPIVIVLPRRVKALTPKRPAAPATEPEQLAVRGDAAARLLGISHDKLKDLAYRGEVPSFRLDGMRLYPVAELRRWVEEQLRREASERAAAR